MPDHHTSSGKNRSNSRGRRAFRIFICVLGLCVLVAGFGTLHAQTAKGAARKAKTDTFGAFKVFDVDNEYGTLSFKGRVERTDLGDKYKYRIQIAVVFLPGEITHDGYTMTNRTKVADLKVCELVATSFVEEGKPYKLIHRGWQPIELRLEESGQVGTLPDMELLMPKAAVEAASHVGLAVTDGKLVWPIPTELK